METEASSQIKPRLGGGSTSFRLRSPSLNSVRLRRIFDIFDKNHDSIITVDELGQALALLGLQTNDLSQLDSMVKAYIQPGNQGLNYQDFEALHRSLNDVFFGGGFEQLGGDDEADLSEAFKVFDEDGDGYISARELQLVLGKLGLQEGKEMDRVEMMISSVDRNHDGRVDFFEFKDMMRSVVVPSS
ncbi:hypothetical protein CASFOL_000642 [Castilleja foliolosa]|uniref:EF-hand domain-containing protein n=1 Tax=Castilleja foliolosa TaxID=1961234 RepID=A0ABD3EL02_9LAMI